MCSVVVFPFVMVCVGTHPVCVPSVAAACGSAKIYRPFFVYVHVHMHMHMSHVHVHVHVAATVRNFKLRLMTGPLDHLNASLKWKPYKRTGRVKAQLAS